jgi:hypothetical protein
LTQDRAAAVAQLRAMTPAERRVAMGKARGATRRPIRRMLEHEWGHRRENAPRLGVNA